MRFVTFSLRCDAPSLIRGLMAACEYFGGLPQRFLTDRMKTVLLDYHQGQPTWHPQFADFVTSLGISPRVCKAYVPQTKGKVERTVQCVATGFWPGGTFTDRADLNGQARAWCDRVNATVHRTTHERPVDRWPQEGLRPLPAGWAWERFGAETRKVSWDGYLSYDGVLYGVPGPAGVAGQSVPIRERHGTLTVWAQGAVLCTIPLQSHAGPPVPHPDQFATVRSAAAVRQGPVPLGHQVAPPAVAVRPLADYDRLCGVEGWA